MLATHECHPPLLISRSENDYVTHAAGSSTTTTTETDIAGSQTTTSTTTVTASDTSNGNSNGTTGDFTLTETDGSQTTSDSTTTNSQISGLSIVTHVSGQSSSTTPVTGNQISGTEATTNATSVSTIVTTASNTNQGQTGTSTETVISTGTTNGSSNDITGDYSLTVVANTTDHKLSSNASQIVTTDNITPGGLTTTSTGNNITGLSTSTTQGAQSTSLVDTGTNSLGTYSVTQTTLSSPVVTQTTNLLTGDYTLTQTGTQTYVYDQQNSAANGNSFSTHETGTNPTGVTKSGNSLVGNYSQTTTGSDSFTLSQSGTMIYSVGSSLSYTETLTATDTSTVVETGNTVSGDFQRTTNGALSNGVLINIGTDRGTPFYVPCEVSTLYSVDASGNYPTSTFSQTKSGTDRYALLEQTNDPSNANGANGGDNGVDPSDSGPPLTTGGAGGIVLVGNMAMPASAIVGMVFGAGPGDAAAAAAAEGGHHWVPQQVREALEAVKGFLSPDAIKIFETGVSGDPGYPHKNHSFFDLDTGKIRVTHGDYSAAVKEMLIEFKGVVAGKTGSLTKDQANVFLEFLKTGEMKDLSKKLQNMKSFQDAAAKVQLWREGFARSVAYAKAINDAAAAAKSKITPDRVGKLARDMANDVKKPKLLAGEAKLLKNAFPSDAAGKLILPAAAKFFAFLTIMSISLDAVAGYKGERAVPLDGAAGALANAGNEWAKSTFMKPEVDEAMRQVANAINILLPADAITVDRKFNRGGVTEVSTEPQNGLGTVTIDRTGAPPDPR